MIDLREIEPSRFPNVFATLEQAGFEPRHEPVPVAPAAHYLMGGIVTDTTAARPFPASMPSASARAQASTAPTGSHRTH